MMRLFTKIVLAAGSLHGALPKGEETVLKQLKQNVKKRGERNRALPYLLLIPTFLFLILFTFYPFLRSIYLSFFVTTPSGQPGAFVGFQNYVRILTSDSFKNTMVVTFKYAGIVCVGTFSVAMFFAFLCVEKVKGSRIYQTMFAIPIALASAPVAAICLYLLSINGLVNNLIGTEIAWLSTKETALYALAVCACWANLGSSFIFLLVGFRNVPDDLVESATLDGASYWKKFRHIYVPIASPQIFFVVFLNILSSYKSFALIKILVGTGPAESTNVLVHALYSNAFARGRFETACVYAMVLCLVIFLTTRIQFILEKRLVHYQ